MLQPESAGLVEGPTKAVAWGVLGFLSVFGTKYASAVKAEERVQRRYPKPTGYKNYTYAEVAKHTSKDDAWVIIEGQVYDVSGMAHPGGDVIFSYAGRDATELFNVMHKNQVGRFGKKGH